MAKDQSDEELRARVFISCGQNKSSEEPLLAAGIKDKLTALGFDPYVAVGEQSLRGLKENLFEQLNKSEYFVFIDFKRERLDHLDLHRGSLFSHQELAVASFLEIDVLALQEQGVKQNDGILGFVQGNAIPFWDRPKLPDLVAEQVQDRIESGAWDPRWRNELILTREPNYYSDATPVQLGKLGRFFHVGVHNRHRRKTAMNCCANLEKLTSLDSGVESPLKTVEFKWEGYMLPNAHIHALTVRKFDAFWIQHDQPNELKFNSFCDASYFLPRIVGLGRYELTYSVIADNFPTARRSFILTLHSKLDETSLTTMPRD
ncbi:MAG: hypothetical protein DMG43_03795 [Acidobacteria bacterium]|nr:MAG: hypothetical protein DMG43_03795 [Acidobacteriota bacterium]